MKIQEQESDRASVIIHQHLGAIAMIAVCCVCIGCRASPAQKAKGDFFTSGSRDADQRASQKMAQAEQLSGQGEGAGEKGVKKASAKKNAEQQQQKSEQTGAPADANNTNKAVKAESKVALYERLGGAPGISNIVDDFMLRALNDPRVNWRREGVKHGGWLGKRDQSAAWKDTPEDVAKLKQHLVEFVALATGGPPHYTGKEIQATHADMHITNPEFDAVVGDLKASLDKLQVPNLEQKELLAIVESTRPQIVTVR
jgi:hemoglobin